MATADFVPKRRIITAITNAMSGVVTALNHGYSDGEYVRVMVPVEYGMRLGNVLAKITWINIHTFSINHDTTALDPFVVPVATPQTLAQSVPISEMTDNIST